MPQLARWLTFIEQFDFEIEHRAGTKHGNADGLSRRPPDDSTTEIFMLRRSSSFLEGESIDPGELADVDSSEYELFDSQSGEEGRVTKSEGAASGGEDLRGGSTTVLEGESVVDSSGDGRRRTSTSSDGFESSEFDSAPDDPLASATGEGIGWFRHSEPLSGRTLCRQPVSYTHLTLPTILRV